MEKDSGFMAYEMKFVRNATGIGYFSCVPANDMSVEEIITYLQGHTNDQFMHNYLLFRLVDFDEDELDGLVNAHRENPLFLAAVYQASVLYDGFHSVRKKIEESNDIGELAWHTPLMFIRWTLDRDYRSRCLWVDLFSENVYRHKPLPPLKNTGFPIPVDFENSKEEEEHMIHIREVCSPSENKSVDPAISTRTITAQETVEKALHQLTALNVPTGTEKRTVSSLSPYALEQAWNLDLRVSVGKNRWTLTGPQISYGKGLEEDEARASYLMEMVERYSSFASFSDNQAIGYKKDLNLVKSTYSHLKGNGFNVLNPNSMNLEVPYEDQELYWIVGEELEENGIREIYVPAQFVFLFCNLDEVSLTSGLSSNGLASGNSREGAKLHGLIEYIERDSERIALYSQEQCFLLETEDPMVKDIVRACKEKGLYVQFLDLTSDLGIPCYKAFIQTVHGDIVKGCAADLNGRIAAVSALTELAYPYLVRSMPPPSGLRTIKYEQLPNYSSGDVGRDLEMLERLLVLNGLKPIYVDLTREDVDIPVVRALIPGLELMAVLDRFSNVNRRQFRNYMKIVDSSS